METKWNNLKASIHRQGRVSKNHACETGGGEPLPDFEQQLSPDSMEVFQLMDKSTVIPNELDSEAVFQQSPPVATLTLTLASASTLALTLA